MSWSYSGNPSNTDKDHVRFLIQDTDSSDQLMSDEEIQFLISEEGNPLKAALRGAEVLVAKFSRLCDEKVGQVSVSFSQKADHYKKLFDALKRRVATRDVCPFAGGITETQKDIEELDDNRVNPFFNRDLHDFRRIDDDNVGRNISAAIQEEEDTP